MRSSRDELEDLDLEDWKDVPRRPVRVSAARWGRDLVVGWAAPWGPSLARVARGQSADDAHSLVLGRAAGADAPQLVELGERLACAWVDAEGAAVAVVEPALERVGLALEGRTRGSEALALGRRVPLGGGARVVAVAPADEGHAWLAVADAGGVRGGSLHADGTVSFDAEPWLRRDGVPARLALAEVGGEPLLVAIYGGERELVVARREGGRIASVTHRLEHPVLDVSITAAGSRVGVALVDGARERVSVTQVDARGRLVERPHVLVDRYVGDAVLGRVGGVAVVWVEDAFRLVVHDEIGRAAYVVPFAGEASARALGRVPGPPSARFVAPRVELIAAEADDDAGALVVVRARPDGSEAVPLEVRLAPPPAVAEERGGARAALCCTEVARTIAGTSYRGAEIVAEPLSGGARIALERTHQALSIRFVDDRRFSVVLETRGEEGEPLVPEPGSFERLAAWVRQRLSASARSAAAREAAWAQAMASELAGAIPIHEAHVRAASERGAVLEVVLAAVPRPDAVERWASRVREQLSAGAHRREGAGD
jgi:hypothetical protein